MTVQEYELVIDQAAKIYAIEYHTNKMLLNLTEEDNSAGRQAAALRLFDLIIEDCSGSGCFSISNKSLQYLDDLSMDQCVRLKAYHLWRESSTFSKGEIQPQNHYITSLNSILALGQSNCASRQKTFRDFAKQTLRLNRLKLIEKKGFWCHLADVTRSWADNSAIATDYINSLEAALQMEMTPFNVVSELLKEYKEAMSACEFLALASNCE